MFWTPCTVIHNRVESKLTSVNVKPVKSTSIEVTWNLDCSDQASVVYGYRYDGQLAVLVERIHGVSDFLGLCSIDFKLCNVQFHALQQFKFRKK